MSLKRVVFFLIVGASVAGFCTETFAQGPGLLRRTGKVLGLGWGSGNHWRNPTVNPGYYNPYTEHNSGLIHLEQANETQPSTYLYGQPSFQNTYSPTENSLPFPSIKAPTRNQNLPPAVIQQNAEPGMIGTIESSDDTLSGWPKYGESINGTGDFEIDTSELFSQPVIRDRKYTPRVQSQPLDVNSSDFGNNQ